MPMIETTAKHEAIFLELTELLDKHSKDASAYEMLAIAGNMVGKIIAMLPKSVTPPMAMECLMHNVMAGNRQAARIFKKTDTIGETEGTA
jgi:transcriptional regulator GlxA family with amidase domain